MQTDHDHWPADFRRCYDKAVNLYRAGHREPARYFNAEESAFLASIGCAAQELYDFAEDWCASQEPSFEAALRITAARRDYFLAIQEGRPSARVLPVDEFPTKEAELAGFAWLPRIIVKARAKLRGELPAELMYCCGGDRAFLRSIHVHPADFLRVVWDAGDDEGKIVDYVTRHAAGRATG